MLADVQRGILGGTFDPPHVAHLMVGEVAYRDLHLDVVTFVPAGAPWQKADRELSSPEHRCNMTRLAVTDVDYFAVDDREITRSGWSYTIDTLESFPEDEELTLILGADSALGLPGWHRYGDVLQRARLAVLGRPGVERGSVEAAVGEGLEWLEAPLVQVSGSSLRRQVAKGKSIRFLVPEAVWRYIEENGLYADD